MIQKYMYNNRTNMIFVSIIRNFVSKHSAILKSEFKTKLVYLYLQSNQKKSDICN